MEVQVENPRMFGHFLGDRVQRQIRLTVPRPYTLVREDLPTTERLSTWLELTEITTRSLPSLAGTRYRIDLVYQIINSPRQTEVIALPAVRLKFIARDKSFATEIEQWPITIAPIAPTPVRTGRADIRPAHVPRLMDRRASETRLALYGAALTALLLYLAIIRWVLPALGWRNAPFAAAHRTMKSLAKRPPSPMNLQTALRAMHRALDQTAGVRLFPEHLDEFLGQHPEFAGLRGAVRHFFEISNAEFFGGGAPGEVQRLDWLLELCSSCEARERVVITTRPVGISTVLSRSP